MIKQKHVIGILLALVMVCATMSIVDTVDAAKYRKIDKGQHYDSTGVFVKYTAYYNGKTVKVVQKGYIFDSNTNKYNKFIGTDTFYSTKVGKNVIKINRVIKQKGYSTRKENHRIKTKLSAKSFYKKKLIPLLKSF